VLNSFNSWKFTFLDPVHEFSWATLLVTNFVDFFIEENALCLLDHPFEFPPVFYMSKLLVCVKVFMIVFISPYFSNVYILEILMQVLLILMASI